MESLGERLLTIPPRFIIFHFNGKAKVGQLNNSVFFPLTPEEDSLAKRKKKHIKNDLNTIPSKRCEDSLWALTLSEGN